MADPTAPEGNPDFTDKTMPKDVQEFDKKHRMISVPGKASQLIMDLIDLSQHHLRPYAGDAHKVTELLVRQYPEAAEVALSTLRKYDHDLNFPGYKSDIRLLEGMIMGIAGTKRLPF
jgi:hypothetical protein